jgi:membrane-associated protease RseP (regulator of RpoE activity)
MDWYTISMLIFIAVLVVILYKDRKNLERQSILIIRRTQRGKQSLIKLGQRFPRFWKGLGTVGTVFGFAMSIYIVYMLIELIAANFLTGARIPGLSFVLPAPGAETVVVPGAILVPFWYWIIAIGLLVIVHEGLHGIMSAAQYVKLKSMGWGVLLVIPMAFVEPDEEQLKKKSAWTQLRVFAAGSFANFMLAGVCIALIISMSWMFYPAGVTYAGVMKDYPADHVNLTGTIIGINDYVIKDINDIRSSLEEIGENQTITIKTVTENTTREFVLTTVRDVDPVLTPNLFYLLLAGHEYTGPGTIDYFMGTGNPQSWTEVKQEIAMWDWTGNALPSLKERSEQKMEWLEGELTKYEPPGFIGIASVSTLMNVNPELEAWGGFIIFIQGLLFWVFLINFGVGAANLLPIGPLDGGRMWAIFCQKYSKKNWKRVMKVVTYVTLALLIINFAFWFGL